MVDKNGYAHPEVLVDADWVQAHMSDPAVRIIEVDVDTTAYEQGHIPEAVGFNWQRELQDQVIRAPVTKEHLEALLSQAGVARDTTIVLYGDTNNWFAAWAFWILRYYGHEDVRLLDGGRVKWVADKRPLTTDVPTYPYATYRAQEPHNEIRAFREQIALQLRELALVDVRSPGEYAGELLAPANLPQEGAQRGGHIPGAVNIPWASAVREDGTFKSADELRALYEGQGITANRDIVAYCRIGERSSHTWFVLSYLLGYPRVRNYDGSWTEWGSLTLALEPIAQPQFVTSLWVVISDGGAVLPALAIAGVFAAMVAALVQFGPPARKWPHHMPVMALLIGACLLFGIVNLPILGLNLLGAMRIVPAPLVDPFTGIVTLIVIVAAIAGGLILAGIGRLSDRGDLAVIGLVVMVLALILGAALSGHIQTLIGIHLFAQPTHLLGGIELCAALATLVLVGALVRRHVPAETASQSARSRQDRWVAWVCIGIACCSALVIMAIVAYTIASVIPAWLPHPAG